MSREYRACLIRGLRELADFLESHPEVPVSEGEHVDLDFFVDTREALAVAERVYPRWEKGYDGNYMWLRWSFVGVVNLDLNLRRERSTEDVEWICDEPGDR